MEQKHVSEALKERKVAEGALKTSFFGNWKPDYDTAAHHFEKSGQFFKLGKSYSESKASYLEAAKCYSTSRVLFSAGKCHEAASVCCKELGCAEDALHHIKQAGDFYTQNGTASTAITCYAKGAEGIADKLPLEAGRLYLRAGELEADNDHPREAVKCFKGAQKTFARAKLYTECMKAVELSRDSYQELENVEQVKKCNLSLVILHLARGDSVAARQSIHGDVSLVAEELINAVDGGDEDTIKKLSTHGDVVYLDTEIARIARFLTQDGAENVPSNSALRKTPVITTTTNSSIFKNSSGNKSSSLHSEREELFGRPNKENRDELFSRRSNKENNKQLYSNIPSKQDELFTRTQADPVDVPQPAVSSSIDTGNPFDDAITSITDDNPFGADDPPADAGLGIADSNPFEDSEDDLC